ncbi:MAG TPA: hypothetical protein VFK41_05190 [Nocardioidaceae bacterium]|nr:hypothetical protein [Nocardioidaceae bacterium]
MTPRKLRLVSLAVAAILTLSACGGDGGDENTDGGETSTPTPTETLPAGVVLTEPGTELSFGESGTVEYAPTQSLSTYVTFTVVDATLGRLSDLKGFNLDTDYKKNANYYFVNVKIENVGDGDLGGRDVPLVGVNGEGTYLPPVVFQSAFPKCPSKQLPKEFGNGAVLETCLVFLSPDKGELSAVSTLTDGTVEAVTWTGEIKQPAPAKKPGRKNG